LKTPTVHVGELALNDSGAFKIGPFGSSLKKTELVESGIPVVGIENVLPNKLVKGFRRFITARKFEELSDYEILPDDVLVTTMGTIGRAASAPPDVGRVIFDSHLFRMRVDTRRVFPPYLCYALNSDLVASQLARMARGAIMEGLNTTILRECSIPLPEMSDQQRIAGRLEQADRLVSTRRYALDLTATFLHAAFLGLFGDPTTNPLGLPVAELGDFLSFVTSGSRGWAEHYAPEGARFVRSLDVRMNNISDEDAVFVNPPNNAEADRTRVKSGDVLLTITGSRIGRVAPVPERLNGAFISQHVAILRLKAGLLPEFLSMFLSLNTGGQRQIARVQYGQTKPGLNLDQIREMRVPVPHVCHQERFLELAKRVERLRKVQREALRQAEHLFTALLHRAFSG
jgi:type I restriction enzyme S subunit